MEIKEIRNKKNILLLSPPHKINKEGQTFIPIEREDKNMKEYKPWMWKEADDESIWIMGEDLKCDDEICDYPNTLGSRGTSQDIFVKVSEIPSADLAYRNLKNSIYNLFEKMASIISFISGPNDEGERFEYCIERFDIKESSSSITSRFDSHFGAPYLKPFYFSIINIDNNFVDFSKSKDSISSIDINHVFPPIGPPLV